MRVFTKINGELAVWQIDDMTHAEAIRAVYAELGSEHRGSVLALVKY